MTQPPHETTATNCAPPVPQSVMTASRNELSDVQLDCIWGEVPQDLHGHIFIATPVGSIESGGIPYADGTPTLNGDGAVYRLDFDQPGRVRVTSSILKPPCYWADFATQTEPAYRKYRFGNHGLGRSSMYLGLRNELNTAVLPIRFTGDTLDRLLVCWDGGRPYEIDLETLEVATAVGWNAEWEPQAKTPLNFVFNPVMT
ncbi:carotenoid oxygenase family protein [Microseira wollei]|uniref:Dioxygenase n=1 Tax=Microseira wollei NIES-4236 TaxID=2530354 RepID=A0AAV3XG86_9CYAN|nr:carotenoid oxygenase family protein [Microseira wollei]GET40895.1 hypothetical protein MiSe_57070 [Microseira wollei NIES-4236]